jgi:transcriptional regulator with XRE-family HTH domain
MARAALGWGVRELAERARLAPNTVSRIENGAGAMAATLQLMQEALENAGVEFIPADSVKGPGVRLAKAPRAKASRRSRRAA